MRDRAQGQQGPFHAGELAVQRRAGVSEDAARTGRIIGAALPPSAHRFLSEQRMAVVASLDDESRVSASLLTGPPGFLRPQGEESLLIDARPASADPLTRNLALRPELGVLIIDLARRQRLRVNGHGRLDGNRILVTVDQVYGNCPKYIEPRRMEPVRAEPSSDAPSTILAAHQQDWIARADIFFIASFHPEGGADASHRGGPPGFISVKSPRTLSFPDYLGNNMFNTLGNIEVQPRVGLLFLDFEAGGTLQLSGRASLDWGTIAASDERHAVVSFELDGALETHGGGVTSRSER
jgi:predicted pyridoxine 5'-phosphate oxidase superfamily flavin-nucleotide-binding protein